VAGLGLRGVCALGLGALATTSPLPVQGFAAEAVAPVNNRDYGKTAQQLIRNARKSIHLMLYQTRFYPEYPDTLTNYLLVDLIEAKKRGVDVKMIVDTGEWNPSQKNEYNADFMDRLTTSGIEIWEDAPQDVSHEKVLLVDDDISLVSSHNWTFYSIANNNEVAAVVFSAPLNAWFKEYFGARCAAGKPRANVSGRPESKAAGASLGVRDLAGLKSYPAMDVQPIANRDYYPAVHDAFLSASKSIDVVQISMTVYPSKPMVDGSKPALPGEPASQTNVLVQDLVAAQKRGVKVRVVLDKSEIRDDAANLDAVRLLQQNGVSVYQDDLKVQTHAKMLRIDGDKTIVGSTNWTYPALENGNEVSVLIRSAEINKVYEDYVETLLKSSAPYVVESKSIWNTDTVRNSKAD
jgi:phosphatidylserine/phosphatidylglycerophosphate/cardiolipin synthase-like enzyme